MTAGDRRLAREARAALAPLLARLEARREVTGIALVSSLVMDGERPTFDRHSDIDLIVWIDVPSPAGGWPVDARAAREAVADRLPSWLGSFSFELPTSWGTVELNLHQRIVSYDEDPRTRWDDGLREALTSTSELLFDRDDRIGRLVAERGPMSAAERLRRLARVAARLEWDVRRTPETMRDRGQLVGAHDVVTRAVDHAIELTYALAWRFTPARKWRIDGLARHGLLDADQLALLRESMRVVDFSTDVLRRRIDALETLCAGLASMLPHELRSNVYRLYSAAVSGNRQLRRRTVADDALERLGGMVGEEVYDLVNYLLPDRLEDLAVLDDVDIARLPERWRSLAEELRRLAAELPA